MLRLEGRPRYEPAPTRRRPSSRNHGGTVSQAFPSASVLRNGITIGAGVAMQKPRASTSARACFPSMRKLSIEAASFGIRNKARHCSPEGNGGRQLGLSEREKQIFASPRAQNTYIIC